jgi:hypothetical protein
LRGYGATSDGYDMVAPSGEGAERCMRMALVDGEGSDRLHQSACDIDTCGRSSGNRRDPRGVRCRRQVPTIAATKSLTGHSLGATGVQEAIYSLLMMNNGFICESANITELDPAFADMPIVRKRIDGAKLGAVLRIPSASGAPTRHWCSNTSMRDFILLFVFDGKAGRRTSTIGNGVGMIIEPRVRGFICTTAHPEGCAKNVREQIDYVLKQGASGKSQTRRGARVFDAVTVLRAALFQPRRRRGYHRRIPGA